MKEKEKKRRKKHFFFIYVFMKESDFQSKLIKEIKQRFPGCFVIKTDAGYLQGFPDLLILYKDKWAALECKKNKGASHRPNQDYYIDILSKLSFSKFIYPENKEEVLNELQRSFESSGPTRVSRSE